MYVSTGYLSKGSSKQAKGLRLGDIPANPYLLPLLVNYVIFSHTHRLCSKQQRSKFIRSIAVGVSPVFRTPELWLVLMQLAYSGGVKEGRRVATEALAACPGSVEVHYMAAKLELSEVSGGRSEGSEQDTWL